MLLCHQICNHKVSMYSVSFVQFSLQLVLTSFGITSATPQFPWSVQFAHSFLSFVCFFEVLWHLSLMGKNNYYIYDSSYEQFCLCNLNRLVGLHKVLSAVVRFFKGKKACRNRNII